MKNESWGALVNYRVVANGLCRIRDFFGANKPPIKYTLKYLFFFNFALPYLTEAGEVKVAAASNFMMPLKEIVSRFERETDHRVLLTFGSSGKIFAQISHGAPFEVFLSADQIKPSALSTNGLAIADSQFTYAVGTLVLWSANSSWRGNVLSKLKSGQFNKLAMANPKLAPYGSAAIEVLTQLNLHSQTKGQWVQGENISQAFQFVKTGNADLGFVARSQLTNAEAENAWIVPDSLHSPIRQDAVLLKIGVRNAVAIEFLRYLRGEKAQAIMKKYGYAPGVKPSLANSHAIL